MHSVKMFKKSICPSLLSVLRCYSFLPFVLIVFNVIADHLHCSFFFFFFVPQAAMCYVHVAALVAEYLHRKSKSTH